MNAHRCTPLYKKETQRVVDTGLRTILTSDGVGEAAAFLDVTLCQQLSFCFQVEVMRVHCIIKMSFSVCVMNPESLLI